MTLDKRSLTERDICTKYVTPALERAGWDIHAQIREQFYFTKGRVIVRGKTVKRGEAKFADYILFYKPNIKLAVIEAKDNNNALGAGIQQGLGYANTLNVPFVFSTNGDGFLFHDRTVSDGTIERELTLDEFPSPEELWRKYCVWKQLDAPAEALVSQDYYDDGTGKTPRYYQLNAINNVIEAVAKGENRVLLVMATGTGKTYTAFQIIWRLWKAGKAKRILFLADRNILVDQTKTNDFKPFGKAMTKITKRKIDKSYEIYLALYQAITGPEESQKIFREFSPDFFDLIVIDECHRGSAAEESAWREILEYFNTAVQVGLTATPKETEFVSNINYFGDPVYSYTLKQGIDDGFLAPYKVIRVHLNIDVDGYRPEKGKKDKHGQEIPDRVYNQLDFDKKIVINKRTETVAKRITEYLKGTNRFDKTIVFCEDIDHASRMRSELAKANADLVSQDSRYVMQITGDNEEGKRELDNFIMPDKIYPVIAVTSRLMTTGVDAKTCKLVVIDRRIESMIEFKQIIGRGTRIEEDYGKLFFTIMDFRKSTELFADPDFDGDPEQIFVAKEGESVVPPEIIEPEGESEEPEEGSNVDPPLTDPDDTREREPGGDDEPPPLPPQPRVKYVVDGVPVWVIAETVQYYGEDGRLVTESMKEFTRKGLLKRYASLDDFLNRWQAAEQKQAIVEELEKQGIFFEVLADEVGRDYDPFDLVCHVAFGQPPLTRRERANNVKKRNYFGKYSDQARIVLEALLEKYADTGLKALEDIAILRVQPLADFGTPVEIIKLFGGKQKYEEALRELEQALYALAK